MADDETTGDESATGEKPTETGGTTDLGEAGQKALDAFKERARVAEKEAKRAKALDAELAKLRSANQTENEKAIAAAKAEGATEERTRSNQMLLRAEVKVAAAGKLADPEDALGMLDLSDFTIGDDGTVDAKAIGKAIDDLIAAKPYLAGKPLGAGSADGGFRGNSVGSDDMNARLRQAAGR